MGTIEEREASTSRKLDHVHTTTLSVDGIELTPPHHHRRETPTYRHTHHRLIEVEDRPCVVCGVRQSTLHDPEQNRVGATQLETHHYPIEWSLLHACSLEKVGEHFPQVRDMVSFEKWVDSPENMLVLCDIHHRSKQGGIHHLTMQDFAILPFLQDGYLIVTDRAHVAHDQAQDEALLTREGRKEDIA